MLSVWWNCSGVVHWEFLPPNATVTADLYCSQMDCLKQALERKGLSNMHVMLLHDNARPHVAKQTQNKLQQFGWEVLPHPPYSPDLAPSDFHLFRALHGDMRERQFHDCDELSEYISAFFTSKPASFYAHGIEQLWQRWQQVIDACGEYIVD